MFRFYENYGTRELQILYSKKFNRLQVLMGRKGSYFNEKEIESLQRTMRHIQAELNLREQQRRLFE